jgi:hypothetical protein
LLRSTRPHAFDLISLAQKRKVFFMDRILERYQIQTLSAQIHRQYGGLDEKGYPLERQCHCLRTLNSRSAVIDLFKNKESMRAYFYGLQTCGSIFSCPICAVKISEHRQKEIEQLLEITQDYHHYLITLTIPHYISQSCAEVKQKFSDARRRFRNWGPVKRNQSFFPFRQVMQHYQYDGSVTTVEVTYGENGWHIHSHELFVFKKPIQDLEKFRSIVFDNWLKAVDYSGIEIKNIKAFYRRSVQVDHLRGDHVNRMTTYLTKVDMATWGIPQELTKGFIKNSENENLTPFGMLHKINDEKDPVKSASLYKHYAPLFWEYCKAFKGSQMIRFSKGLKQLYEIGLMSNEEIVNGQSLFDDFYGYFEKPEFDEIKRLRLRGWVIKNSILGWDELKDLLESEIIIRRATKNDDISKKKASKLRLLQSAS